jgi:hypothetical protein
MSSKENGGSRARIDMHQQQLWSQSLRSDMYHGPAAPPRAALKPVTANVVPVPVVDKEQKKKQRDEHLNKIKSDRLKAHAPMVHVPVCMCVKFSVVLE